MHKKIKRKGQICFVHNKYMGWQLDLIPSFIQPIRNKEWCPLGQALCQGLELQRYKTDPCPQGA